MKVFLSYASEDSEVARELAGQLTKAGLKVWDRADELYPGDNWPLRIGQALETSNAMVVLISPRSMKSDSVRHEIDFALGSVRYKGRLIPAVVKPSRDMPWILRKFPMVPLQQGLAKAVRQIAEYVKHGFELKPAAS